MVGHRHRVPSAIQPSAPVPGARLHSPVTDATVATAGKNWGRLRALGAALGTGTPATRATPQPRRTAVLSDPRAGVSTCRHLLCQDSLPPVRAHPRPGGGTTGAWGRATPGAVADLSLSSRE